MAEKQTENKVEETPTVNKNDKIKCVGPVDKTNGAEGLLFTPKNEKKESFVIVPGQTLIVSDDVTIEEAKELLQNPTWEFKEVK
jgi:hypothetical protein